MNKFFAILLLTGFVFIPGRPVAVAADFFPQGALLKPLDNPTVYIISGDKKRPFPSAEIFLAMGYSFKHVMIDRDGLLPLVTTGYPVASAAWPHPEGTLVNDRGAVFLVTGQGKMGIQSAEIFESHGFDWARIVPANNSDRKLHLEGFLDLKSEPQ